MKKILLLFKKILFKISQYTEINNTSKFSGTSRGIENVKFEGNNGVLDRCNFLGKIKIGQATTLGSNNVLHGDICIGKYCQIGFDVAFHAINHPSKYLTTYIHSNLFNGQLKQLKTSHKIIVGNDVWIGHNAMIIGNVNIGNGAIIAAGAVVTKDVPAYSVVAGVPAHVIKKRFNDKIIQEIENLKWWNKTEEELKQIKPLFFKDLSQVKSIYTEDIK